MALDRFLGPLNSEYAGNGPWPMNHEMAGRILQVNISPGGIPKRAIEEAIVTSQGIQGDSWAHPEIHGGPNQALLLITGEGIDELKARGYPLYAGALGENLTTSGLDRRKMRVGQRYRAGQVLLELTKLRGPCSTLDVYGSGIQRDIYDAQVKAGDPATPRWGLSGFYARVVRAGVIRPHDIITLVDQVV
jgi:MOSC domain-containing protein YiiM